MMKKISLFALLAMSPLVALADTFPPPNPLPEPGAFALLGIGAAAAAVVWLRGRNKK